MLHPLISLSAVLVFETTSEDCQYIIEVALTVHIVDLEASIQSLSSCIND